MTPIPMPPSLEPEVRALYHTCHPGWGELSPHWFFAYPTLVILNGGGSVIAYASYSMNVNDAGDLTLCLQDTCVSPSARGKGLSRILMNARLEIGHSLGAMKAVGMTQPNNAQMLGLLRSLEFREVAHLPKVYSQADPPQDGIVFVLDDCSAVRMPKETTKW